MAKPNNLPEFASLSPVRGGWRGAVLRAILRRVFKKRSLRLKFTQQDIEDMRGRLERVSARAAHDTAGLELGSERIGGVPAEVIQPASRATHQRPTLLYFHGGAYLAGGPNTHRAITCHLAREVDARVIAADYRLAPEHPFPAATEDGLAIYRALLDTIPPHQLAVAGDSAGGNLVLTTLLNARAAGLPLPAAAVCISPWSDMSGSGRSVVTNARADDMLPASKLREAAAVYAPGIALDDPRVSPLFDDLTGLPPLLVHVGNTEILLDDSVRLVAKAREAGVDATLRVFHRLPHVFHAFATQLPAGALAVSEIAAWLLEQFAARQPTALQSVAKR